MKKAGERRMEIRRQDNIRNARGHHASRMVKVRQRFDRSGIRGTLPEPSGEAPDSAGIASRIPSGHERRADGKRAGNREHEHHPPGNSLVFKGPGRPPVHRSGHRKPRELHRRRSEGKFSQGTASRRNSAGAGPPSMDTVLLGHTADGDRGVSGRLRPPGRRHRRRGPDQAPLGLPRKVRVRPHENACRGPREAKECRLYPSARFRPLKDRIPAFASRGDGKTRGFSGGRRH